jgi:hypothetical protein
MKDALKRAAQLLGLAQAPAQAEVDKQDVTAGSEATGEGLEVFDADGKLVATSDTQAALTAALAELGEVRASLAEVTAALSAVHEAKELAEANALATKLAARKEKVVAALGTALADVFMGATESMPDAQFDTVMAAMAVSSASEADSLAFKQLGVEAQANVDALVAEAATSGTGAMLAAKYQKQASK